MAITENEAELVKEEEKVLQCLKKDAARLRMALFFSHPTDKNNCFLSVQSGAGGTEAQDWAEMLLRMYSRWAQQNGYEVEELEESPGEEAGIKSATIKINGNPNQFPYGWLKAESGVHRLVRISPFDASARRHTSFTSVWVSPEIDEDTDIEIEEKELRIDTYRASGAGGQHVNKTDSAVRITHLPTGIVVQCQNDRSQHKNRSVAMKMIKARLYEQKLAERKAEEKKLSSELKTGISWGNQIRSYVLQPYQLVKDLRSGHESSNPLKILEGDIGEFLEASLE